MLQIQNTPIFLLNDLILKVVIMGIIVYVASITFYYFLLLSITPLLPIYLLFKKKKSYEEEIKQKKWHLMNHISLNHYKVSYMKIH